MNQVSRIAGDRPFSTSFSAHEYEYMLKAGAFSDMRVELVGGVLEKMMPCLLAHGECTVTLATLLSGAFSDQSVRVAADLAVRLDEITVRAPDIVVCSDDTPPDDVPEARYLSMAVEVADTTLARDLGPKAQEYARAAIATYWVVDVKGRVVHAMGRPGHNGYAEQHLYCFGEPMPVPGTDRSVTLD